MGLWSWITGMFGFGSVKVLLWKYSEPLSKSKPVITGAVLFKSKKDAQVLSLEVKVIEETTSTEGEGENKKTETDTVVLGSFKFPDRDPGVGYPLDLKAGVDVEQTFEVHVAVNSTLQGHGTSMLGGMLSLASSDKVVYYLVAHATVKGSTWGATAKEKLKIAE